MVFLTEANGQPGARVWTARATDDAVEDAVRDALKDANRRQVFAASGIGNGSTFRTIGVIFDRQQAGPVLGWTSAVAAYGAFIAPVIIGQQITVSAARTALGRLAARAGTSLTQEGDAEETSAHQGVTRLFPRASAIAALGEESFAGPRSRSATITSIAEALASGELQLSAGDDIAEQHAALTAFTGIGDWTAGYVSMRVLANPDVLLTGDVALRSGAKALGLPSEPKALIEVTEQFRPWRSYLSLHLWGATPPRTRAGATKSAVAQTTPLTTETPA